MFHFKVRNKCWFCLLVAGNIDFIRRITFKLPLGKLWKWRGTHSPYTERGAARFCRWEQQVFVCPGGNGCFTALCYAHLDFSAPHGVMRL